MTNFNNPFTTDRAEQLGNELFKFFAHHKKLEGKLKRKSLVVQGGRGSGKTMFFLYNTYKSKKTESESSSVSFDNFISTIELIGLHFRCDSNFVPAFQLKGIENNEWESIFAHYLDTALSKQLTEIIIDINNSVKTIDKIVFTIQEEIEGIFGENISSYEGLLNLLKREEIKTVNFVNNGHRVEKPIYTTNGFLINLISNSILAHEIFKERTIQVFIDEYENLLEYQQVLINTLIKHPSPTVFNIGTRNEGIKTFRTMAEGESISAPHDFSHFDIEDFSKEDYDSLIFEVCRKRLQVIPEFSSLSSDSNFLNIKFYLGDENFESELEAIFSNKNGHEYKKLIRQYYSKLSKYSKEEIGKLYEEKDVLLIRLIMILIDRGVPVGEIQNELIKYETGTPSKFKDWIHNNKNGILFLVCKENRKKKLYYGYNTFISLSSGIIRYYIELCEVAFRNANRNGFDFRNPRQLNEIEQSDAARYVSRYKINDIEHYSNSISQFINLLGNVFEKLHRNPKLSEPEQNHFSTEYEKLSSKAKTFLSNAVLYSVLQKKQETKEKSNAINSNKWEFHLNHIYTPYFEISARKKRKLEIKSHIFEALISEEITVAEMAAKNLVPERNKETNGDQLHLTDLF